MLWRLIVLCFGGFWSAGPYEILIHDTGIHVARDMVIRWQWRVR